MDAWRLPVRRTAYAQGLDFKSMRRAFSAPRLSSPQAALELLGPQDNGRVHVDFGQHRFHRFVLGQAFRLAQLLQFLVFKFTALLLLLELFGIAQGFEFLGSGLVVQREGGAGGG